MQLIFKSQLYQRPASAKQLLVPADTDHASLPLIGKVQFKLLRYAPSTQRIALIRVLGTR
ncbi:hypothetical protein P308_25020 [Pseudomonas piscis]|nr:hypothetical protein P308_25020 [Pseudomonas piscis]